MSAPGTTWAKEGSAKTRVADMLANGFEVEQICGRLGMTRKAVNARISDIRRDLGWQAA